uniref:Protein kinase domain-containing protein n=1 Tax=Strongyloides stercoralis TaxID=6248 RepID=A0A0K0EBM6_STRER
MSSTRQSLRKGVAPKNPNQSGRSSGKSDRKKSNNDILNKYVFPMTIISTYNGNSYYISGLQREGKFGGILVVIDKNTNDYKSIKFGLVDHYHVEVDVFTTCMDLFPDTNRISKIIDYGFVEGKNEPFILMENMGQHLGEYIQTFPSEIFDTLTGMTVLLECLKCIQFLHSIGFVHRNIKPSSFYIELNNDKSIQRMFIADFEGAQRMDLEPSKLGNMNPLLRDIYVRRLKERTSGLKYCPVRQHTPTTPIFKDDLESWFYLGIIFFEGALPWSKCTNNEEEKVLRNKHRLRDPGYNFYKHTPIRYASLLPKIDAFEESAVPDYNLLINKMEKYIKYLSAEDKSKIELTKEPYIEDAEKRRKEELILKDDGKEKKKPAGSGKGSRGKSKKEKK